MKETRIGFLGYFLILWLIYWSFIHWLVDLLVFVVVVYFFSYLFIHSCIHVFIIFIKYLDFAHTYNSIQFNSKTLLSRKHYIKWKFSFRHTCSDLQNNVKIMISSHSSIYLFICLSFVIFQLFNEVCFLLRTSLL